MYLGILSYQSQRAGQLYPCQNSVKNWNSFNKYATC